VCVGYGFGDHHVNEVLKEWLEFSSDRSIEIVNPSLRDIPSFLLHLAPQVRIVNFGATEYFDCVAGIERTEAELLSKQIWAASRRAGHQRSALILEEFRKEEERRTEDAVLRTIELYKNMEACDEDQVNELVRKLKAETAGSDVEYSKRLLARFKET